jgi:hypothetical protein
LSRKGVLDSVAIDKVYQLLAHVWWFSLAFSTTKTGRNDIAEILLKVALKHNKSIKSFQSQQSIYLMLCFDWLF